MNSSSDNIENKPISWLHPLGATRKSYNWVMSWAERPGANRALAILSAAEAIFFPIPVDPLLVAMGCAKPKSALWHALIATIFSVLGGLGGYYLGYLFWDLTSPFFYSYVFPESKFQLVMSKFNENGFAAIFLASFTPIPYKVFTIAAGVAQLSLVPFLAAAFVGRGLRYFLISSLLYLYGPPVRRFIDRYLEKLSIVTGLIIVIAIVLYKFLH